MLKNKWLKGSCHGWKPLFYMWHVDCIFVLFSFLDHAEKFREYLSSKYCNKRFSSIEKNILLYPGLSKVNLLSVEINIKKVENSKKLFTD